MICSLGINKPIAFLDDDDQKAHTRGDGFRIEICNPPFFLFDIYMGLLVCHCQKWYSTDRRVICMIGWLIIFIISVDEGVTLIIWTSGLLLWDLKKIVVCRRQSVITLEGGIQTVNLNQVKNREHA